MREPVTISIPSHPKFLSVARAVTGKLGHLYNIDESLVEDIKLAIDEACTNVIKHAYRGDTSKKIILKYNVSASVFQVSIEDRGKRARMDILKGRNLDDVRPGGLGIHLIKRVFDVFNLDERRKTGNRLILIKYLKESQ